MERPSAVDFPRRQGESDGSDSRLLPPAHPSPTGFALPPCSGPRFPVSLNSEGGEGARSARERGAPFQMAQINVIAT